MGNEINDKEAKDRGANAIGADNTGVSNGGKGGLKDGKGDRYIFFWEMLKRTALMWACTLGVMIGFGLLLDKLEQVINGRMFWNGGRWLVIAFAAVGTPIHELSHALFCLIFRFPIREIQLFRPQGFYSDGVLGYVKYSRPLQGGFFTTIGEFFVGFGPLILGGLVIILMIRLLIPEISEAIDEKLDAIPLGGTLGTSGTSSSAGVSSTAGTSSSALTAVGKSGGKSTLGSTLGAVFIGFWKGLFSVRKWGILRAFICFYLCLSISMHMTLSPADINNSLAGLGLITGLMFIYGIISALLKAKYVKTTLQIGVFFVFYYLIGLICDLIILAISFLFQLA